MDMGAASDPSFLSSLFLKSLKGEEGFFIYFPIIHEIFNGGS